MSRLLRFLLTSPFTLTPAALLFGGLLYRAFPVFATSIDSVYALWDENAAPYVVGGIAVGIVTAIVLVVLVLPVWNAGAPARAEKRKEAERERRDLLEQIAVANSRREAEDRRQWVESRLKPWRGILDDVGESALVSEIEPFFAPVPEESRMNAARRQDAAMLPWLVAKAVAFEQNGALDPSSKRMKIHTFLDHAFRIAGQQKGWRIMQNVPGSAAVLVPFFRDQVKGLTDTWGGPHDTTRAFTHFTVWAVSATVLPTGVAVSP